MGRYKWQEYSGRLCQFAVYPLATISLTVEEIYTQCCSISYVLALTGQKFTRSSLNSVGQLWKNIQHVFKRLPIFLIV